MKKVLIAYFSATGNTEKMAGYIAEGVRFSGQEAIVKKISDIDNTEALAAYDGCLFGSPTYSSDIPEVMKSFLSGIKQESVKGKPGGAFGSYTHDGNAPALILDTLTGALGMEAFELGALRLKEAMFQESGRGEQSQNQYIAGEVVDASGEGMHACQDYGRVFGESLDK